MNTATYLVVLLVLSHVVAHLLHRARLRRVFFRGTETLTKQLGDLRVELDRSRELVQTKNDDIARFAEQRDEWHQLYVDQSIGHGNAQNLMMGEIEKLARLCASKGISYKMPTVLKAVREEFLVEHESAALEDRATAEGKPPPAA